MGNYLDMIMAMTKIFLFAVSTIDLCVGDGPNDLPWMSEPLIQITFFTLQFLCFIHWLMLSSSFRESFASADCYQRHTGCVVGFCMDLICAR
jgi:hypothetical protein